MNEETETTVLEDTEIVLEDTETVEDTELSDYDFSAKIDEILRLLNGEADADEASDPGEESSRTPDGLDASAVSAIDYSNSIEKSNECLTVIVMILIFWFCVWMLDKWRVWAVKGGR